MDLNDVSLFGADHGTMTAGNPLIVGVKPVDEDTDHSLLVQAIKAHQGNRSLADNLDELV